MHLSCLVVPKQISTPTLHLVIFRISITTMSAISYSIDRSTVLSVNNSIVSHESSPPFSGSSPTLEQADAFKAWLQHTRPGDVSVCNLSVHTREQFAGQEEPIQIPDDDTLRGSVDDRRAPLDSFETPTSTRAINIVSTTELNEEAREDSDSSAEQPRLEVHRADAFYDPSDPLWDNSETLALSFFLFVQGERNTLPRPHHRVIPVKRFHAVGQVEKLADDLEHKSRQAERIEGSSVYSKVSVTSLLEPPMEALRKELDRMNERVMQENTRMDRATSEEDVAKHAEKLEKVFKYTDLLQEISNAVGEFFPVEGE